MWRSHGFICAATLASLVLIHREGASGEGLASLAPGAYFDLIAARIVNTAEVASFRGALEVSLDGAWTGEAQCDASGGCFREPQAVAVFGGPWDESRMDRIVTYGVSKQVLLRGGDAMLQECERGSDDQVRELFCWTMSVPDDVSVWNVGRDDSSDSNRDFLARRDSRKRQSSVALDLARSQCGTVSLRDADLRDPFLWQLADSMRKASGLECGISVYYTPAGCASGVEAHVDSMDVIAWQMSGSKQWITNGSRVPLLLPDEKPPASPLHERHYKKKAPSLVTTLRAERLSVLYVPRGVIHATSTKTAFGRSEGRVTGASQDATPAQTLPSIHLSIGLEVGRRTVLEFIRSGALFRPPRLSECERNIVDVAVPLTRSCLKPNAVFNLAATRASLQYFAAVGDHWRQALTARRVSREGMMWLAAALDNSSHHLAQSVPTPPTRASVFLEEVLHRRFLEEHFHVWLDNARCDQDPFAVAEGLASWAGTVGVSESHTFRSLAACVGGQARLLGSTHRTPDELFSAVSTFLREVDEEELAQRMNTASFLACHERCATLSR